MKLSRPTPPFYGLLSLHNALLKVGRLFCPTLYYWGGGVKRKHKSTKNSKKLIRLITGLKRLESCRQKFKENKILTVTSMYILEVLCFTKKPIGVLKRNYEIHEHNTRNKYNLHIQPYNTSLLQNVCCIWVSDCTNCCP